MAECRSCKAPIVWAKTEAGKLMPLDPMPVVTGTVALLQGSERRARVLPADELEAARAEGKTLFVTHWSTCPDSKDWKAKRRRG